MGAWPLARGQGETPLKVVLPADERADNGAASEFPIRDVELPSSICLNPLLVSLSVVCKLLSQSFCVGHWDFVYFIPLPSF